MFSLISNSWSIHIKTSLQSSISFRLLDLSVQQHLFWVWALAHAICLPPCYHGSNFSILGHYFHFFLSLGIFFDDAQWFQMAKIHQKISWLVVVERKFSSNSQLIHIISVSGDWMHFISKFYQSVADITMASQFTGFLNQILSRFT